MKKYHLIMQEIKTCLVQGIEPQTAIIGFTEHQVVAELFVSNHNNKRIPLIDGSFEFEYHFSTRLMTDLDSDKEIKFRKEWIKKIEVSEEALKEYLVTNIKDV